MENFFVILLLIGVQSACIDCIEPPRVVEYDADVPNTYNGGLREQLYEGNEKMAKFIDSSRVELSPDQFNMDSYIQAYKLTHENYQNSEEQTSIDVARENRASLEKLRVKRYAQNAPVAASKPQPIKFEVTDAKNPDAATLQVMRTKKELRNVRSPYEVVEHPAQKIKSSRIGHRMKLLPTKLYSGAQTHRYGLKSEYNRVAKPQPMIFRKADTAEFGAKLWWNPAELNRYKRLQNRAPPLHLQSPTSLILANGLTHPTQQTYLAPQQQQQIVTSYIPYQEYNTIPQTQLYSSQQQYYPLETEKFNYLYNQFPQYNVQKQQQIYAANPYGPLELHYDQAKTQYVSAPKIEPSLEALQSLLGQNPNQQLQGLKELLGKEELYQQEQYHQLQYQQQRPQDSTAPILFHPSAEQALAVTKPPQYQYTVAGSTKQIIPIPTSTSTTPAPVSSTTVAPTTIHYQDILPASTPAPFSAVTIESPLKLLPAPVQLGPESQPSHVIHNHNHLVTPTPQPLSQSPLTHDNSLNSLQKNQQQSNDDGSSHDHDDNHDVSISRISHKLVKRSAAAKRRPSRQPPVKFPLPRQPPTEVEYYYSQNPEYDFFIVPRTKKPPKRVTNRKPEVTSPLPQIVPISSTEEQDEYEGAESVEERDRYENDHSNYETPEKFSDDAEDDGSSSVEYEVIYDENEFYKNRQHVLNLTEQLRKKNNDFFAKLNASIVAPSDETPAIENHTIAENAGERLKYENIFNKLHSPFNRKPKLNLIVNSTLAIANNTESVRPKRDNESLEKMDEPVVNFSELKKENYGSLRIDLGVNSTIADPDGDSFNTTKTNDGNDILDDMNEYFFDENGTLIENFDELHMMANETRILYHLMPVSTDINNIEGPVANKTSEQDLASNESRSISERSSYAYAWEGDDAGDDDDEYDGQYVDNEHNNDYDDEYEEEERPHKKVKIIKVIEPKWRSRKANRKRVSHRRQKYKIVPVTVYKKIPIKQPKKQHDSSNGEINIHNVNIYEKPPAKKIIHHRPEWHFTQTIKKVKKPKRWYRSKPTRQRNNRSKFNKIAWLLQKHHA